MSNDITGIMELYRLIADKTPGFTSISIKSGDLSVKVDRSVSANESIAPPAVGSETAFTKAESSSVRGLRYVKSPIVGTFYSAPSPGAEPFVSTGQTISKGQTLCIIEAMKTMNEIESDFTGKLTSILVENGALVEFDQSLFEIMEA